MLGGFAQTVLKSGWLFSYDDLEARARRKVGPDEPPIWFVYAVESTRGAGRSWPKASGGCGLDRPSPPGDQCRLSSTNRDREAEMLQLADGATRPKV